MMAHAGYHAGAAGLLQTGVLPPPMVMQFTLELMKMMIHPIRNSRGVVEMIGDFQEQLQAQMMAPPPMPMPPGMGAPPPGSATPLPGMNGGAPPPGNAVDVKRRKAMPSKTLKQHKAMGAAAKGKSSLGIPRKVGKDFIKADKGKSFKSAKKPGK